MRENTTKKRPGPRNDVLFQNKTGVDWVPYTYWLFLGGVPSIFNQPTNSKRPWSLETFSPPGVLAPGRINPPDWIAPPSRMGHVSRGTRLGTCLVEVERTHKVSGYL